MDLSLNNLNTGLEAIVRGISDNNAIVALKMRNNCIEGRK